LGIGLRCGSATTFAVMAAVLKHASNQGVTVDELIFFRSLGAVPLVALWVLTREGVAGVRVRDPRAHLTRAVIGTISMGMTFGALALLPIAQATTLSYSAPIAATILSALVLHEAVGRHRWAAVLVGFAGVALVADPFAARMPVFGLFIGICAALGQAAVMITLRQVSRSESTSSIVFWFSLFTLCASALLMPVFGHWRGTETTTLLFLGGAFGGIGQLMMTGSLRFAPVPVVVPFDYLQILWATLIGWLVFASPPPATMLAGAALIAASGIYTAYREGRRGWQAAQALAAPEA
jgi:drug/metabolite transporter (DMT)-like permease